MPLDSATPASAIARNNGVIEGFINEFALTQRPIEVNFRALVPEIRGCDRYTHLIHTYPAKLLVQIPNFFLRNSIFSHEGDVILDPFCGSGTVLLESILAQRTALGADSNPLARLISTVKVNAIRPTQLYRELNALNKRAKTYRSALLPDVVNCDYWFPKRTSVVLSRILRSVKEIEELRVREFMLVCFSNLVRKVSLADQNVSVPVRLNPGRFERSLGRKKLVQQRISELKSVDLFAKFDSIASANIDRMVNLIGSGLRGRAKIVSSEARALTRSMGTKKLLAENSVSLIISSPPYAGAQKYIRSSSLHLGWTELSHSYELPELNRKTIGREQFRNNEIKFEITGLSEADQLIGHLIDRNPVRAAIVNTYLVEMMAALREMVRVLKPNGYLILVIGNNRVCDLELNNQQYFSEFLGNLGLRLQFKLIDHIQSYGLMTKRNKTADIISREWVLVFRKSE